MKIKVTVNDIAYVLREPTVRISQMASKANGDRGSSALEMIKLCLESVDGVQKSPIEIEQVFAEMKLNCYTEIARAFEQNLGKYENSATIEEIY